MNDIANSKRITHNTLFLYIRMFFLMFVSLYTSRIILDALGVIDYGIYNVVGGLTASFAFFSSSLSNATQRFLSVEIGSDNRNGISAVYSSSIIIYAIVVIVVFIAIECVGYWFLNTKMVIPIERIGAANLILHTTAIGLVITIFGSIYDAVLIAYENMRVYAYLSIFEVVLRLIIAYALLSMETDKLKIYAILYLISIIVVKLITIIYCKIKYNDCKFAYSTKLGLMKRILEFIGWNGVGTAVWMVNEQGVNILLNIFFGPVVNAARGLAMQVGAAINNFSTSFFSAIRPQIIKSYATNNLDYFYKLIYSGTKYSFYLVWIIVLPIVLRSSDILRLWLIEVPDYTVSFVQWIAIFYCVNVLTNPLWGAVQAVGNLRRYVVVGSLVFLSAFPLSYIFLKIGAQPVCVFIVLVFTRIAYVIVSLFLIKGLVSLSIVQYVKRSIWPIVKVVIFSGALVCTTNAIINHSVVGLVCFVVTSIIIIAVAIYAVGIDGNEREIVNSKIKNIVRNDM